MRGIAIKFDEAGCNIDLSKQVEGFDATTQNALTHVGTEKGSDKTIPSRGTDLLRRALNGALISPQAARHASNFAALDVLTFTRVRESSTDERMTNFVLKPARMSYLRLEIEAQAQSSLGRTIGLLSTVTFDG